MSKKTDSQQVAWGMIGVGAILTLTGVGAVAGLPLLIMGLLALILSGFERN